MWRHKVTGLEVGPLTRRFRSSVCVGERSFCWSVQSLTFLTLKIIYIRRTFIKQQSVIGFLSDGDFKTITIADAECNAALSSLSARAASRGCCQRWRCRCQWRTRQPAGTGCLSLLSVQTDPLLRTRAARGWSPARRWEITPAYLQQLITWFIQGFRSMYLHRKLNFKPLEMSADIYWLYFDASEHTHTNMRHWELKIW